MLSSCTAFRIGASGLRSSCDEHGEELVLAPVGLAERVLEVLPLGDVRRHADDAARCPRRVEERRHHQRVHARLAADGNGLLDLERSPGGEHPAMVALERLGEVGGEHVADASAHGSPSLRRRTAPRSAGYVQEAAVGVPQPDHGGGVRQELSRSSLSRSRCVDASSSAVRSRDAPLELAVEPLELLGSCGRARRRPRTLARRISARPAPRRSRPRPTRSPSGGRGRSGGRAETKMIAVFWQRGCWRIISASSKPSSSGMQTSISTTAMSRLEQVLERLARPSWP